MAQTHTVVINVPLRIAVYDAADSATAVEKARGAVYEWLAQVPQDGTAEKIPPTVLSVEPKK